jgi:hypothetical protein
LAPHVVGCHPEVRWGNPQFRGPTPNFVAACPWFIGGVSVAGGFLGGWRLL